MLNIIAGSLSVGVAPVTSSYESIATVTVGAGGSSSISFTSIPSTFTHLQIRGIFRSDRASSSAQADALSIQYNSDASTSYRGHSLFGNGATASAGTSTGIYANYLDVTPGATSLSSTFASAVIDILDYTNTSKTKVMRGLSGCDLNGSGVAVFSSGMWPVSNQAISSIKLQVVGSIVDNFVQYSSFALYGIKGA